MLTAGVRSLRALLALALAAVLILSRTAMHPSGAERLAVCAVLAVCAALVGLKACSTSQDRPGFSLLAVSFVAMTAIAVVRAMHGDAFGYTPTLTATDIAQWGVYPLVLLAAGMLVHTRVVISSRRAWLDGAITALAAAGLIVLLFSHAALAHLTPVALTFSVCDIAVAATAVGFIAVSGGLRDRTFVFLFAGLLAFSLTHGLYTYTAHTNAYAPNGAIALGRLCAVILMALCAWQPRSPRLVVSELNHHIKVPVLFGALAITLQTYDHFMRVSSAVVWLSSASLAAVIIQLVLTFRSSRRLLGELSRQALHDSLTGLPNRRALMADIDRALGGLPAGQRLMLALFDLNGFKSYNDSFGHPAGDALLDTLGVRFRDAAASIGGRAYRMGGDEFCALTTIDEHQAVTPMMSALGQGLSATGDGFSIHAAGGHTLSGAGEPALELLRRADQAMYESKRSGRASAFQQATDVLLAVQSAARPGLPERSVIARMATDAARALDLPESEVLHIAHAADLRDIGTVAIGPEALDKPAAPDGLQQSLIGQHTVSGERIVSAAPSLRPVARLIRSSHERFDGGGYPDGLAGEAIPLGSQIVFVCDAFAAMTSGHGDRAPLTAAAALATLKAGAGTQFAPRVVEAFCGLFGAHG